MEQTLKAILNKNVLDTLVMRVKCESITSSKFITESKLHSTTQEKSNIFRLQHGMYHVKQLLNLSNKVVFIGFCFKIDTGFLKFFNRALVGFYSWKISVFYIVFHLAIHFCSNTIFLLQHLFINFNFCFLDKNLLNLRGWKGY